MKKEIIKLAGLAMLLLTVGVMTAQPAPEKRGKFEEIDVNNDEMISMSELKSFRIAQLEVKGKEFSEDKFLKKFAKADANSDGLLSKEELKRGRKHVKRRKGKE